MGYPSINVTIDRYGHLIPELDEAIAVFAPGVARERPLPGMGDIGPTLLRHPDLTSDMAEVGFNVSRSRRTGMSPQ
jgi:hypothetical protein